VVISVNMIYNTLKKLSSKYKLHLFGVSRLKVLERTINKINSFDSSLPIKTAVHGFILNSKLKRISIFRNQILSDYLSSSSEAISRAVIKGFEYKRMYNHYRAIYNVKIFLEMLRKLEQSI